MIDAGTLVDNGGSNDETGLVRTWSLTFRDEESLTEWDNDARRQSYSGARTSYNLTNGITETNI